MYKRQVGTHATAGERPNPLIVLGAVSMGVKVAAAGIAGGCLLYTSDAADERSRVDLGGRRIIKKKKKKKKNR